MHLHDLDQAITPSEWARPAPPSEGRCAQKGEENRGSNPCPDQAKATDHPVCTESADKPLFDKAPPIRRCGSFNQLRSRGRWGMPKGWLARNVGWEVRCKKQRQVSCQVLRQVSCQVLRQVRLDGCGGWCQSKGSEVPRRISGSDGFCQPIQKRWAASISSFLFTPASMAPFFRCEFA